MAATDSSATEPAVVGAPVVGPPVVGEVAALAGGAIRIDLDGVRTELAIGAEVREGDVIAVRDGPVELRFGQARVFLEAGGRLLLDRAIDESGASRLTFFVIQGDFAVDGAGERITVRTPVATVALDNARLAGRAAGEAQANAFMLIRNGDGSLGSAVIATAGALYVLDAAFQAAQVVSLFRPPEDLDLAQAGGMGTLFGDTLVTWLGLDQPVVGPVADDVGVLDRLAELVASFVTPGPEQLALLDTAPTALAALFPAAAPPPPVEVEPEELIVAQLGGAAGDGGDGGQRFAIDLAAGNQFLRGTAGLDVLEITADPVGINDLSLGQDGAGNVVLLTGDGTTITIDDIEEIELDLGLAGDSLEINDLSGTDIADSTLVVAAGGGDDVIDGQAAAKRLVVDGGAGDDLLLGGTANDDLFGAAGDDTLAGGGGNDLLDGGAGRDVASFEFGPAVAADLAQGTALGAGDDTLIGIEDVLGSAFGDALIGDGVANLLDGGGGDDTLIGGGGGDSLIGGAGQDLLDLSGLQGAVLVDLSTGQVPAAGIDLLSGVEDVLGTAFDDTLTGDGGANHLRGGGGDDLLTWASGTGDDTLDGGAGADRAVLSGGAGGATLAVAAAGADIAVAETAPGVATVTVRAVEDLVVQGAGGADVLSVGDLTGTGAGPGAVELRGGGGDDVLDASAVVNAGLGVRLFGEGDDDVLRGGAGDDALDGGGGNDRLLFDFAAAAVAVDLGAGTATGQGTDSLSGIENVTGSAQADAITGSGAANDLIGGLGADTLDGAGGDDTLTGGGGADSLVGGLGTNVLQGGAGDDDLDGGTGGFDIADYSDAAGAVQIDLGSAQQAATGGLGKDTFIAIEGVIGSAQGDALTGNGAANLLDGGGGDDVLSGGGGDDTLIGGAGDDVIDGRNGIDLLDLSGAGGGLVVDLGAGTAIGQGTDTIAGIEAVQGAGFADSLTGAAGAETLTGGAGADTLLGLGGDDRLVGGSGDDSLTGGDGADLFFFAAPGEGVDQITDFLSGVDQIGLDGGAFGNIAVDGNGGLIAGQSFFTLAGAFDGTSGASEAAVIVDGANQVHFDPDGDGGQAAFTIATVTLAGGQIQADDFQIS